MELFSFWRVLQYSRARMLLGEEKKAASAEEYSGKRRETALLLAFG